MCGRVRCRYADNIIKSFATSFAIILSCVVMWLFMDFHPSLKFALGVVLVNCAVYLYGNYGPSKSKQQSSANNKNDATNMVDSSSSRPEAKSQQMV